MYKVTLIGLEKFSMTLFPNFSLFFITFVPEI